MVQESYLNCGQIHYRLALRSHPGFMPCYYKEYKPICAQSDIYPCVGFITCGVLPLCWNTAILTHAVVLANLGLHTLQTDLERSVRRYLIILKQNSFKRYVVGMCCFFFHKF